MPFQDSLASWRKAMPRSTASEAFSRAHMPMAGQAQIGEAGDALLNSLANR